MIKVTVNGSPAAQGNHRVNRSGHTYDANKALGPWREAIRTQTQLAMAGREPLTGPVSVLMEFRLKRPKAHYRTGRHAAELREDAPTYVAGKPDGDKLVRALFDALVMGGAVVDDSQFVIHTCIKWYAVTPGVDIEIYEGKGDEFI